MFEIRYVSSQDDFQYRNNSNLISTFLIIVSLLLITQPTLLSYLLFFSTNHLYNFFEILKHKFLLKFSYHIIMANCPIILKE